MEKQGFESGTFATGYCSESGTFRRSSAVLVGIFQFGNDMIKFSEFGTAGSNIFNFGTTGSDLISIWNGRIEYFEFGTTGSDLILIWERQDQFF